ncbi:MAG: DotU family type IV/VI secretion system protein [Bryobacter sp.]|jgi:type VI secretion system protein ImpK|nr:DotU family type IV/VI secretion system protein [Bryobacter sp. CoA8 C33]
MERETLAVIFQEPLTAVARIWSNPRMTQDPLGLRENMKNALRAAVDAARRNRFSEEETKLAMFAIVAYLDETILTQNQTAFSDWRRKPLQEELFGVHIAGEIFFQNLENILRQTDSLSGADLLELYALCISLGFRGRYSAVGQAELKRIVEACLDKVRRVRGAMPPLGPSAELPQNDFIPAQTDPWLKRMALAGGGLCVLAAVLFVIYKIMLGSAGGELQTIALELTRR